MCFLLCQRRTVRAQPIPGVSSPTRKLELISCLSSEWSESTRDQPRPPTAQAALGGKTNTLPRVELACPVARDGPILRLSTLLSPSGAAPPKITQTNERANVAGLLPDNYLQWLGLHLTRLVVTSLSVRSVALAGSGVSDCVGQHHNFRVARHSGTIAKVSDGHISGLPTRSAWGQRLRADPCHTTVRAGLYTAVRDD